MYLMLVFLSVINGIVLSEACELYYLGQCAFPMSTTTDDLDGYCAQVKIYINCFNKKLKNCEKKIEFRSALETVKLNLKSLINQAKLRGCKKISEKLKLSENALAKYNQRVHRTKKSTTTTVTSPSVEKCDQDSCNDLLSLSLKQYFLNHTLNSDSTFGIQNDDYECKLTSKYLKCLSSSLSYECKQVYSRILDKVDSLNRKCFVKTKPKLSVNTSQSSLVEFEWKCFILTLMFKRLILMLL